MDKKLTDSEVIEDLNLWIDLSKRTDTPPFITYPFLQQILDLINRLQAENERLKEQKKSLVAFKDYFGLLYGRSLEVANWHLNGDLEPLDSFIDSAIYEMGEIEIDKE